MLCLLSCPNSKQQGGLVRAKMGLVHRSYCTGKGRRHSGSLAHLEDKNLMAAASSGAWRGLRPSMGIKHPLGLCCGVFRGWSHPSTGAQLLPANLRATPQVVCTCPTLRSCPHR